MNKKTKEVIFLNNVKQKYLYEICNIKRGERITKKDLVDNGKYGAISGGNSSFGRINKFNREANTITIAQYGSAGFVNFQKEKFWANDVVYSIFPNINIISNKFLYYCLLNKQEYIYTLTTKALPNHLPIEKLNNLFIPIPPLEVQNEIVKILDKYIELEKELEKELELRTKQYEYYRDKLLNNNMFNHKRIEEVADKMFAGGTPMTTNKKYYNGDIFWLRSGEIKFNSISETEKTITLEGLNNSSAKLIKPYSVVIALTGGTVARSGWTTREISANQSVCAIETNNKILNYKFLYYFLESNYKKLKNSSKGVLSSLNLNDIKKTLIPIPSIQEQQKIVNILDKFSNIIKDLKNGIPKEIESRIKQYKYYRNRLLTFNEVSNE